MSEPYTIIIGLEVHVQLATASKLFCSCSTRFGGEPNTQTCPVCIGLPGSLPVMNRHAVELALKTAVALNCEIPARTKWDRKQYYYPDLPKGYQISQFDLPMSANGVLEISDAKDRFAPKVVRIIRAHLEEDAGKSLHDEGAGKGDSLIDLNRTGTPLLEIVTQPDLRSSAEAAAFLKELRLLLTQIAVSDCNMQEGSLRVDANINLHIETPKGKIATPIVEIKNMNSFRAVERALDYEAPRQYAEWQETGRILGQAPKQTRGWDDVAGVTRAQRSKEESSDYRYFPDPDLVPVAFSDAEIAAAKASLGELPAALRGRLSLESQVPTDDADVIVNQGPTFVRYFFDAFHECPNGKLIANWLTQNVLKIINANPGMAIESFPIPAKAFGRFLQAFDTNLIPRSRAWDVLKHMFDNGRDWETSIQELGVKVADESELISLCDKLLAANPKIVADVKSGNLKAASALIGQARKLNPNADAKRIGELIIIGVGKID